MTLQQAMSAKKNELRMLCKSQTIMINVLLNIKLAALWEEHREDVS